ncbi:hypothetical protein llap_5321 [Limosa lapponica baueri]|uniref:Uncharacterized protein n=1 Tax=Limosa lapponica baueri TaxID=1758121 RepID=A0A2I0UE96_LIMLA|nr:hypothetical protein llap_5321 [Limosa lapponica baueri]
MGGVGLLLDLLGSTWPGPPGGAKLGYGGKRTFSAGPSCSDFGDLTCEWTHRIGPPNCLKDSLNPRCNWGSPATGDLDDDKILGQLVITESHGVGRNLWRSSSPTPLPK